MQETKNSSWYSTVAGALFAFGGVMELFQWLRILRCYCRSVTMFRC